jgi:hypothetical protein
METESGVMPGDVEPVREGERVWLAIAVLFIVNGLAAYVMPSAGRLAERPEQQHGGLLAMKSVIIVQLGLLIPAVIIAGVIAMFPSKGTFNERWYRALRWTMLVRYAVILVVCLWRIVIVGNV